ncbi:MAG: hypothetical protein B6A08_00950 [Sorangiineae bacterium NIC37A_2]|nr:MAG: hypothetical protein B6A08_00950 [Sorangiineae bacterium NIC37A_2]
MVALDATVVLANLPAAWGAASHRVAQGRTVAEQAAQEQAALELAVAEQAALELAAAEQAAPELAAARQSGERAVRLFRRKGASSFFASPAAPLIPMRGSFSGLRRPGPYSLWVLAHPRICSRSHRGSRF